MSSTSASDFPLLWKVNTVDSKALLPIVFFDRDDTLIVDCGQTNDISNFSWTPQALEVLNEIKRLPVQIGIATNQSGLADGKYSFETLNTFTKYFMSQIQMVVGNMPIMVLVCPHNAQNQCKCRKPEVGLLECAKDLGLGEPVVFFGDSEKDFKTAEAFGIKGVLISESDFALRVREWIRVYF
jgi:D-glycero-D-manno-heptose 1,7-bisphosphate phosphatase